MIKVTISRNDNKKIVAFTMNGHAQFAEHGKDLVCAGASAVSFGTINAIHALCRVTPHIDQAGKDGGYLRCEFPTDVDSSTFEKMQVLLEGMVVSLQTIELDYGNYIKIQTK
ncbi:ribosomal-processing cysteine protease Prp [Bacillus sp. CGMCC 1.16541]|uniref:ribosomal-processing cysteine protease Prp n=1 Tax=Bacillus sp. CGMCC 1.16541 TaxID=2185143 RepID=UPI000D7263CC|nr:ribosomal-processing cysteine protease Prp [Bacillus sp. CGMCC 1.16541]